MRSSSTIADDRCPRARNPNGGGSDLMGATVTVTGIVVETGTSTAAAPATSSTAPVGIAIYLIGRLPVALGDEIEVTGTVGHSAARSSSSTSRPVRHSAGTNVIDRPRLTGHRHHASPTYENVGQIGPRRGHGRPTSAPAEHLHFRCPAGTDTILVYIDSTTGIDITAVDVGDIYAVISPVTVDYGLIEMKPRFQSDLVENPGGDTLPVISNVDCDNWVPMPADPITISATITDDVR